MQAFLIELLCPQPFPRFFTIVIDCDEDVPERKYRKFISKEYVNFDKQITQQAYRVQNFWNVSASKRDTYKRREAFPEFGKLIIHVGLIQSSSA